MEFKNCPKCNKQVKSEYEDCPHCGICFAKFNGHDIDEMPHVHASKSLQDQWTALLENYTDQLSHDKFVENCMALNMLPFASQQYRRMKNLNPLDEMAVNMQEKIIQLVSAKIMYSQGLSRKPVKKGMGKKIYVIMIMLIALGFISVMGLKMIKI